MSYKSDLDRLKEAAGSQLGKKSNLELELYMNKNYPLLVFVRRIQEFTNTKELSYEDCRWLAILIRFVLILTGFHPNKEVYRIHQTILSFCGVSMGFFHPPQLLISLLIPIKKVVKKTVRLDLWDQIEKEIINDGNWRDLQSMDNSVRLVAYLAKAGLLPKDDVTRHSLLDKLDEKTDKKKEK